MAQLIDYTYFSGPISLPASALSGDFADIDDFIEKYEKEALIDLLGNTLYIELKAEIDATPQTFTTKWDRLVNGYAYTEDYAGDEHTVSWNGLVNTEKESLLAYYIYFKYVKFHVSHTASIGEVLLKGENSDRHQLNLKLVNAWNEFVRLRGDMGSIIEPTAYNFLNKFEEDSYDKWLFKKYERMNFMGL